MAQQEALAVDAYDFMVPCRRFLIDANVTTDRQMPVVDEFVLRLVKVATSISVERLRRFFGFSDDEIMTCLLDLKSHGLVELEQDTVSLTSVAKGLFLSAGEEETPRLASVEQWKETVWFDLISKNMASANRLRPAPYLPVLREQKESRLLPEQFAREAFESNFSDYARRVRRHPDADRLAIYSVSKVQSVGYGFRSLHANCGLTMEPAPKLGLQFPAISDEPITFSALTRAAADEWKALSPPEQTANGLEDYEVITGDKDLGTLLEAKDVVGILQRDLGGAGRVLVGSPYLPQNVQAFVQVLSMRDGEPEEPASILWLRPSGMRWGRTALLPAALQRISEVIRGDAEKVPSSLIAPRALSEKVRYQYKRVFDNGLLLPLGNTASNIEILYVPSAGAVIVIHALIGEETLPVGLVTSSNAILDRLARRFKNRSGYQTLWNSERHAS